MTSSVPRALERWLRLPEHKEVPASWVPGLDDGERRTLHAMGGVAAQLLSPSRISMLPSDVRAWMSEAPMPPEGAMDDLRTALATEPDNVLAALYSTVVRAEHRRQLGTFFTPTAEVKLMLDLWSDSEDATPSTVIDVGAGVGVFTAEAATRWPDAHVIAVDINPVTLGLLAVRLFGTAHKSDPAVSDRAELVLADYTTWLPSDNAPAPGGRLILGNPPYTRAQLLSTADRDRLHNLTDGICGTRASLSTLITALTLKHLDPTDGLSLLLPAQWLESQYARRLRQKMWNEYRRRVELRLVESEDLFGGAQVDAVALLVGTEQPLSQPFRVAPWRRGTPRSLDRTADTPASWRPLFDPPQSAQPDVHESVPLSEFASVRRGIATGANALFVLSTADAQALPDGTTTPVITKLHGLPEDLDEDAASTAPDRALRHLLTVTAIDVRQHPTVREIVQAGEGANIHERVLCAARKDWFDLTGEVRTPDVVVGAMTQNRFSFVRNRIGATITNNLYGLTWLAHVDAQAQSRIVGWLRSEEGQAALVCVARRQGAGLIKLEPGGLRQVRIPVAVVAAAQSTEVGAPGINALVGSAT